MASGGVVDAEIEGHFIVLWRTTDGRLAACEGRCPHQWSPLDLEGAVEGDELVCRTHGWRFSVDGTGTKVNVKGRRDAKSDIETYRCVEIDGEIWVDVDPSSI
ncbi:MAG: Rieske 2Fe-2S domain-containing protein [Acidimicrobiales bacterium]